ncbi:MAG TPA: hypothetical protein VE890_02495 [Thermoguttaceae bacterium]|nr:hypothetical protein [Thermoguttaceae bacterium]
MAEPSRIEAINDLAERWRRWTQIVRLFAVRNERRHTIDPTEYRTMHAALTNQCRTLTQQRSSQPSNTIRELPAILAPWLNLDSLARADRELVCQLFERCCHVQQALDSRASNRTLRHHGRRMLLAAAATALVGVVLWTLDQSNPLIWPAVSDMSHWFHAACNAVARTPAQQRLVFGGILALLGTMAVVVTSARRT